MSAWDREISLNKPESRVMRSKFGYFMKNFGPSEKLELSGNSSKASLSERVSTVF